MAAAEETAAGREESYEEALDREADENRREALLASTQSLQPNFNRPNVTQKQISKLQELHKRRMQIKAKSKIHKKPKGDVTKSRSKNLQNRAVEDGESSKKPNESSSSSSTIAITAPKKLHWGLDTKERWERKANM